jgi:hypothetical protein
MGLHSKLKGNRGEWEFAKLTNGKRVPLSGSVAGYNHDVILPNGWSVEVKRKKTGFKTIYNWMENSQPDLLAFRADHKPWLVVMELEKFLELTNSEN